jgi:hypothetical protein
MASSSAETSSSSSSSPPSSGGDGSKGAKETAEPALPPLTPAEFQQYNRLADQMNMYHEHFRKSWNLLWDACEAGRRPAHTSLRAFVSGGLDFVRYLTAHHNFEEAYLFPVLAKRMPEFRKGGKGGGAAELLRQHKEIHKGLGLLDEYLRGCRSGEHELDLSVLKTKMESWRQVLWTHLDQEVKTLGAENMRRYWTLDDMRQLPE